jgi:hypothetical protein
MNLTAQLINTAGHNADPFGLASCGQRPLRINEGSRILHWPCSLERGSLGWFCGRNLTRANRSHLEKLNG